MIPRPRVSLRVFLALCVAVGIGVGIFRAWILEPLIKRADAERHLRDAGVMMVKDGATHYPSHMPISKNKPPAPHEPSTIEQLLSVFAQREIKFETVTEIWFIDAKRHATDSDMEDVLQFSELETLYLSRNELTVIGSTTTSRSLGSQEITDRGIAKIAVLPNLRKLILSDSNVSDAAFDALRQSRSLETIGVQHSKITDVGLLHLAAIPSLKKIDVANNEKITAAGDREFRRLRPDVKIWSSYSADYPRSALPDFSQ